jgi:diaminopimelate decarboxylase
MDYFHYKNGRLHCEEADADSLAGAHGTPLYVYSARTILEHYRKLREAFHDPIICYSVKANSNLSILKMMAKEGSGFDVVSGGELYRALKVGADPKKIVYAGVGKTDEEIVAGLRAGILLFNIESEDELENVDRLAGKLGKTADVALRINPDVDPATHVYISTGKRETKFGVDLQRAEGLLKDARRLKRVRIAGLHVHIGSQITKTDPYIDTLTRLNEFIPRVREQGHPLEWLDMGGGFGIWYKDKAARSAADIASVCMPLIRQTGLKLILEPGRFIVGNAGILLTRVLYVKDSGDKKFIICDAGMHDLIRPALYGAYHRIWPAASAPTLQGPAPDEEQWTGPAVSCDVVGPICESADFLAKDRRLPPVQRGDLLAVFSAGAYGFVMASNYNSFPRPAEVLVSGAQSRVVTKRQTYDDVLAAEKIETF